MICVYLRATGAYEAVQGLSDLFPESLQDDDVQDLNVRWDKALLSVSEMPSDVILEGLYKSKLQDSVQLQTVLALYDQETVRNNRTTEFFKIEDFCDTSKFLIPERSCWERISHPESKRKESLR